MVKIRDVKQHLKMRPMKNPTIIRYGYSTLKILNGVRNALTRRSKNMQTTSQSRRYHISTIVLMYSGKKSRDKYDFIIERRSEYLKLGSIAISPQSNTRLSKL